MLQNNKLFKTSVKWLQTLEKGSVTANKQQATWYIKNFFGIKYNFPNGKGQGWGLCYLFSTPFK